jgi:microcin C transport system substrate-binding protein
MNSLIESLRRKPLLLLALAIPLGLVGLMLAPPAGAGDGDPGPIAAASESIAAGGPASSAGTAASVAIPAEPVTDPGEPLTLPEDIAWETNYDDPPIGSPDAIRGGTFNFFIGAYPMTFRLMGPNSNDAFAAWNRSYTFDFTLVRRHPWTDRYIPFMATHWSIQDDQRTIFFRLDPDARWSDGQPITADDYVFTFEMMSSEHILDPYYSNYIETFIESIDRVDDYTVRVVGTRPSWRPLTEYGELWPTPRHAHVLDAGWVDRMQNTPQVAAGPYVVSETARGESVTFQRIPDWWGDDKHYFQGMFNFDRIHLRVIPIERSLDHLRRGELDLDVENTARIWNEEYTFPAVRNGWLRRSRVFVDVPSGVSGLHMNLEAPIFQNRDFRLAMHYLFNFERLNRNLMYQDYFRQNSFFEGTEYANPEVRAYPFDPIRAREHLERAGYRRPDSVRHPGFFGRIRNIFQGLLFTRATGDDILVNDRGEKASFTLTYGSKGLERHLTVVQQEYRRAGIDMQLRLLEPGTAFERGLERKYEMTMTGRTAGFYPSPRQYLHTDFKTANNNNNIWGFGTAEVDSLIAIYEEDLDFEARRDALYRVDEIVHEEAFYIPFWTAPYIRLVYWDYIRFPEFYLPRRTQDVTEYQVYWIDPDARAELRRAMSEGRAYEVDPEVDRDYFGLRERYEG